MPDQEQSPNDNLPALQPEFMAMVEFVMAQTTLQSTPHVPEIVLHLADDAVRLWHKIDVLMGRATSAPPYWAFAWAGGQALARYVLDNPRLIAGRRVLDLGSGSGVSAIAAAKAGAARVIANDVDFLAAIGITLNADANAVAIDVSAADLFGECGGFDPENVDVVLTGDIFYEPSLAVRALAFLRRCQSAGALILVGDPGRAGLPKDQLNLRGKFAVPVSRGVQYSASASSDGGDQDLVEASVFEFAAG
jgi:predicted nicotinamide N-methyase